MKDNEHKERIYFYFNIIHSYGASIIGIIFGLIVSSLFFICKGVMPNFGDLFLYHFWPLVAFMFWLAREDYKTHLRACRDIYIRNNIDEIIRTIMGRNSVSKK